MQLVFRKSCHLLIELEHNAYWAIRTLNFDLKVSSKKRFLQLNALDKLRFGACESS